jgi:hypothetical protein
VRERKEGVRESQIPNGSLSPVGGVGVAFEPLCQQDQRAVGSSVALGEVTCRAATETRLLAKIMAVRHDADGYHVYRSRAKANLGRGTMLLEVVVNHSVRFPGELSATS